MNYMNKSIRNSISISSSAVTYHDVKLSINSGIISLIYSHLCRSFSDFYGFLIGGYSLLKNTNLSDSNESIQHNVLAMNIKNVIFIYDKIYLKDKLDKLIDKLLNNKDKEFTIIGIFSARSFSFPNISFKEQEFYLRTIKILQEKRNDRMPLLFGSFCHNDTTENEENKVKTVNFNSRIYQFSEKLNEFITVPYEIVNIKDTSYTNPININANKIIESTYSGDLENIVCKLKKKLYEHVNFIDTKLLKNLNNLKIELNAEIEENKFLNQTLKSFEN